MTAHGQGGDGHREPTHVREERHHRCEQLGLSTVFRKQPLERLLGIDGRESSVAPSRAHRLTRRVTAIREASNHGLQIVAIGVECRRQIRGQAPPLGCRPEESRA